MRLVDNALGDCGRLDAFTSLSEAGLQLSMDSKPHCASTIDHREACIRSAEQNRCSAMCCEHDAQRLLCRVQGKEHCMASCIRMYEAAGQQASTIPMR
jgi:hypothetical protein